MRIDPKALFIAELAKDLAKLGYSSEIFPGPQLRNIQRASQELTEWMRAFTSWVDKEPVFRMLCIWNSSNENEYLRLGSDDDASRIVSLMESTPWMMHLSSLDALTQEINRIHPAHYARLTAGEAYGLRCNWWISEMCQVEITPGNLDQFLNVSVKLAGEERFIRVPPAPKKALAEIRAFVSKLLSEANRSISAVRKGIRPAPRPKRIVEMRFDQSSLTVGYYIEEMKQLGLRNIYRNERESKVYGDAPNGSYTLAVDHKNDNATILPKFSIDVALPAVRWPWSLDREESLFDQVMEQLELCPIPRMCRLLNEISEAVNEELKDLPDADHGIRINWYAENRSLTGVATVMKQKPYSVTVTINAINATEWSDQALHATVSCHSDGDGRHTIVPATRVESDGAAQKATRIVREFLVRMERNRSKMTRPWRALLEIRMDGMPSIAQEIVIKKALPAGWSLGYDGGSWFRLVGPQYTFLTIRLMAPDGRLTLHGGFSIEKNSSGHNELFSADFNGDLASDVIDEVETAAKAIRPQRSFAVLAEARDRLSKIYAYRSEEKEREFTTHGVFLGHYLSFGLQRKEQERFYVFKATMNDNKFLVCKVSSENQSRATVVIPSLVISVDNIVRAEEECRKTVDMLKPYQQMILDFNKDVMGKKNG